MAATSVLNPPPSTTSPRRGLYQLRKILTPEEFEKVTTARRQRDAGAYHVTVLTRLELKVAGDLDPGKLSFATDWRALGLGSASSGTDTAYFVVLDWPGGHALRKSLGFPPAKDFHITLGFTNLDVHGVRKDRSSLIRRAP
jgi:hypothetical protein